MDETAHVTAGDHRGRHELAAVVLLSLVAVMTAWCGFEAAKWGGDSSVAFSESSIARIQAADLESQARDARMFDLAVYSQWVIAEAEGDQSLADYIQARFTPALATAFTGWDAGGRQENAPFARDDYVPPGADEAAAARVASDASFENALDYNQKGDNYSLMTVLFALVLFLAAIAQRGMSLIASRIVLGMASTIALVGAIVLLTFPVRL